jgi:hypothetical protein
MERMNGTIKSRTKSMAGMYDEGTTMRFADGFSIYYNYMRPHIALHHMTPAMMLGITNEQLTWLDMIAKSKKSLENPKER